MVLASGLQFRFRSTGYTVQAAPVCPHGPSQQTSRQEDTEPSSEPGEGRGGVGLSVDNMVSVRDYSMESQQKAGGENERPLHVALVLLRVGPQQRRRFPTANGLNHQPFSHQPFLSSLMAIRPLSTCAILCRSVLAFSGRPMRLIQL